MSSCDGASNTARVIPFEDASDCIRRRKHRMLIVGKNNDLEEMIRWGERLSHKLCILPKNGSPTYIQKELHAIAQEIEDVIRIQCESHTMPHDVAVYSSKYIANTIIQFSYYCRRYISPFDFLVDGIEKRETPLIRKNAEVCFLIFTVFSIYPYGESTKLGYYYQFGEGLYGVLSKKSFSMDDVCMADYFALMSCITRQALKKLGHL